MKKLLLVLSFAFTGLLFASNVSTKRTVTGWVMISDTPGVGQPGVSVVEKGTTNGTVTDAKGEYSITVDGPGSVLVYSFLGCITQEDTVGNKAVINKILIADY